MVSEHTVHIRLLYCSEEWFADWYYPNLQEPFWRICWAQTPGAILCIRHNQGRRVEEIPMSPSRMYVIPADLPYSGRSVGPHLHSFLHFAANRRCRPDRLAVVPIPASPLLRRTFKRAAAKPPEGTGWVWDASAAALHLATTALLSVPQEMFADLCGDPVIDRLIAAVERSPGESWPNTRLAEMACMTTNAFIRRFKLATGRTPQSMVTTARVHHAAALLASSPQMSINRAAEAAGFCSRYYMSAVFKRMLGVSPAAFAQRTFGKPRKSDIAGNVSGSSD